MLQLPKILPLATLAVDVPFRVKGKARPRFNMKSGCAYMPQDYTLNIQDLQWRLRIAAMSNLGFMSPSAQYRVLLVGFRKRRQAKTARQIALRDQECPLGQFATGKPDVDNLLGTVMDAATAILYADDLQVVDARVARVWSEQFGAVLEIDKLTT